jgi:predicted acetyltransferase
VSFAIRRIVEQDLPAFHRGVATGFGLDLAQENTDSLTGMLDLSRTACAFDGAALIGTTAAFALELTVPGGTLPMAGTTFVTVLPTHRRRGALRQMMHAHFDDTRARGEPLAGLWASESSIYGRFGYGAAAYQNEIEIDVAHARLRDDAIGRSAPGSLRLFEAEDTGPTLAKVYDHARRRIPGALMRSEAWWQRRILFDPPHKRNGTTPQQVVLYEEAGTCLGYMLYRRRGDWRAGLADNWLLVTEIFTASEQARAALWRYALSMDLVAHLFATNQPPDELLPSLLAEPRRLRQSIRDSLWLRILDMEAALGGRRYSARGRLAFAVRDEVCRSVEGVYVLEGGPDGAACRRARGTPDIELSAETMGALYLGAHRFQHLARAGLVKGSLEALRLADAMFMWDPLPFCPDKF